MKKMIALTLALVGALAISMPNLAERVDDL